MTSFESKQLGLLAADGNGSFVDGPFGSNLKASEYIDAGIPIIRLQNVRPNYFLKKDIKYISKEKANELHRHNFRPGDLVIAKLGDPCGIACLIPHSIGNGIVVADVVRFRGDRARVCHKYLAYYLNSPAGRAEVARLAKGTTRQRVNLKDLKTIPVPVPKSEKSRESVAEQKRIADILDKADAIRQKRREAAHLIDEMAHSIFITMVGPGAREYDSWKPKTVQQLAARHEGSMRTGPFGSDLKHSEFVDQGVAVLGIDNAVENRFTWGERRFITKEKYEQLQRCKVYPSDVIITIMGTVGRSAVVPDDIPLSINTKHLACITLDREAAEPEFLANAIHRHPDIVRQLGVAGRGAIMTGLNLGIIKSLRMAIPPIEVQREFAHTLAELRKSEKRLIASSKEADDLFNSLVQRAFRGGL